jgi:hypothetical protein
VAKCAVCGTDTPLHVGGRPICFECDKLRMQALEMDKKPVGSEHSEPDSMKSDGDMTERRKASAGKS